jgi:hypothetical protein
MKTILAKFSNRNLFSLLYSLSGFFVKNLEVFIFYAGVMQLSFLAFIFISYRPGFVKIMSVSQDVFGFKSTFSCKD